jgi:hypothetical protein
MSAFTGPLQALNFGEAGSRQSLGELVNGPAIGGHDLVVEGGDPVTYENRKHERPGRGHYSPELSEHTVEILRWQMDQRAPGQDAGDGVVGSGEIFERPELIATARVGCLRVGDELWDHVDSRCVDAQRAKVIGDMPRPTAEIEHRARSARQMSSDEGEVVGVYLLLANVTSSGARHRRR